MSPTEPLSPVEPTKPVGPVSPVAHEPLLSALVVHWQAEDDLEALLSHWPTGDTRFEVIVVNNGCSDPDRLTELCEGRAKLVEPGCNLGFAGGVNRAAENTSAPLLLLLNPDAYPTEGALDALLAASEKAPGAAGFAPNLVHPDGRSQARWQLRPLPSLLHLLRQGLFLPGPSGPAIAPPEGAPIGQPAAAALLIRRTVFQDLGGFDEGFHPAWHEDVDFAKRLRAQGEVFLFASRSTFVHGLGGSVSPLGYGRFLVAYYRNLAYYLSKHHGPGWALLLRILLVKAAFLRILALPLRQPSRALNRSDAARGLLRLARAAAFGFPDQRPSVTSAESR